MQSIPVTIKNKTYTLHIAYQENDTLRKAFNSMTYDFWEFTFESYYQSGFWDDTCLIFSLFEGETIVSHTTLSLFTVPTTDQQLRLGQLGTVMTHPDYTKRGLSRFLMEYVFEAYRDQLDGYFLFANETVLDFYPKFGFVAAPEFQASKKFNKQPSSCEIQRLNLTDNQDLQLFQHYLNYGKTACRFDTQSYGLAHFYCYANPEFGFADSIYVIPELETLLIAQQEEDNLLIFQAYYLDQNQLEDAFHALATEYTTRITLGFTPVSNDYTFTPYKEEDLTLFVTPSLVPYFTEQQTMIPLLSHT
ncbi:GNAT family N-acetyltransferase [Myroides sp. WP-1]|uniref:GNAT family N-acetyltransferase n=1 Tax=Myroides sp. WP-1 TaxID=2759944 RepID=UPI0015FE1C9C|nr:GNAT family N-acetyltransferase [Myroides sp. WP-1]MBB1140169.1 GNAT family N-acetyltransferase [Myroides sp. WP-1]